MIRKNAGTITSDSTVDTMMPPITAVAIGARNDPPSPTPSAEGSMPADIAMEVITMGRARLCPASITGLKRSIPCARISMAKSIKRMAFLVTIPISIRMPISTGIDSAEFVRISAAATPPMASGSEKQDGEGLDHRLEQQDQHRQHQHQAHDHRIAEAGHQFLLHLGIA
jgi:hypothetical protein